jgi:hypothetical protein
MDGQLVQLRWSPIRYGAPSMTHWLQSQCEFSSHIWQTGQRSTCQGSVSYTLPKVAGSTAAPVAGRA